MRRGLSLLMLLALGSWSVLAQEAGTCEALIRQSDAQLEAMRLHAAEIEQSLQRVNEALARAEARNARQTRQIEQLQRELEQSRLAGRAAEARSRRDFFSELRHRLPLSSIYQVMSDRLVIAIDPVYVRRHGVIGEEGQSRLRPLVRQMRELVGGFDDDVRWRLRIEGHSDSRPLRSSHRFANNWELSAARAVSMLDFLVSEGLPENRLSATGLADTRLVDLGRSAAAHRRNRRIEIHLEIGDSGA